MRSIRLLSLLVVLGSTLNASAMELGQLSVAGTGCFGSNKLIKIAGEDGRYAFPIRVKINKKSETSFDRKTCNLRLPVVLAANEKLQLVDLSQVVRIVAAKGAEVKTSLSMGLVGVSTQALVYETRAADEDISIVENLKSSGVVAESACGKNLMLTGNLSALVNGSGTQAFVSTGTAILTLKVVNCNQ